MKLKFLNFVILTLAHSLLSDSNARAGGLHSQMTAVFPDERDFKYEYGPHDNSITLEFTKTTPEELQSFENYDEALVKRVVIKDMSPNGTSIKIVLKNSNIRTHIQSEKEPFRVIVDLFEKGYFPEKDLLTDYPIESPRRNPSEGKNPLDPKIPKLQEKNFSIKSPKLLLDEENSTEHEQEAIPSKRSRRLLQPLGQLLLTPEDFEKALGSVPDGLGDRWKSFPPYIYRISSETYEKRDSSGNYDRFPKLSSLREALTSSQMLAEYASKFFDMGNENKALVIYNQLLQKDPEIFEKDPTALWKLAEVQLGQGNLTLARGYYETLLEKHPESSLSGFAQLRILDIQAIRLIEKNQEVTLPNLLEKLEKIKIHNQGELSGQVAIRKAYWSPEATKVAKNYEKLPRISSDIYNQMSNHYPNAQSSKTAFIMGSLIINEFTEPSHGWNRGNGTFSENYFKRFSSLNNEKTILNLKTKLYERINSNLQNKINSGYLIDAIEDYENLPSSMKSIRRNPQTAWALAEAFRNLDQRQKAQALYQEASTALPPGTPDRFKSEFWSARLAMEESRNKSNTSTVRKNFESIARKFDEKMSQTWNKMNLKDRETTTTAYKEHFEKTVTDNIPLRRPAIIVLSQWTNTLNSKSSTGINTIENVTANPSSNTSSPTSAAVFLISDLSKLFGTLGMKKEKRESTLLLKNLKPSDFGSDQAAKNVWADQLTLLAEDYRKANQYLDAGRLFSLVGENGENYEKRAETLYKSGLLLFRAGRKQEAINSFQKASEDGNNLFYANLAKERLNQIQ
jgi:tetratricopeptide (TPR) repeat protein